MYSYRIAELLVQIKMEGELLEKQSRAYRTESSLPPDFVVGYSEQALTEMEERYSHLTRAQCEYLLTGFSFYRQLLKFNGIMLHSSAVAFEDKAYLFSANCGTGKSTHTELWQHFFGETEAKIINDDKPAIRLLKDRFYVYGTPWSGKSDKNLDIKVPLRAIAFIEQSETNWIKPITPQESIFLFMEQTVRPNSEESAIKILSLLNQIMTRVAIFRMGCNISEDAVQLAYQAMKDAEIPQERQEIQHEN